MHTTMRREMQWHLYLEDKALAIAVVPRGHLPALSTEATKDMIASVPDDQDAWAML